MSMKMTPPRSRREWTQPAERDGLPDVRRAQFVAMMRAFHFKNERIIMAALATGNKA